MSVWSGVIVTKLPQEYNKMDAGHRQYQGRWGALQASFFRAFFVIRRESEGVKSCFTTAWPHGPTLSGAGPQKSISHMAASSVLWAIKTKALLLFLLKPSSLLSLFSQPVPSRLCPSMLSAVSSLLPAACCLPTCLPAHGPAFHFKASGKSNPHLCTHFLNPPEFHPVVQSGFCPLLACLGSPATHLDAVTHHILWPSSQLAVQ